MITNEISAMKVLIFKFILQYIKYLCCTRVMCDVVIFISIYVQSLCLD